MTQAHRYIIQHKKRLLLGSLEENHRNQSKIHLNFFQTSQNLYPAAQSLMTLSFHNCHGIIKTPSASPDAVAAFK